MDEKLVAHSRMKGLLFIIVTLLVSQFWILSSTINVYKYAIVGVLFELLWLPMLLFLFIIPIVSLFFWSKNKWRLKTVYPFCILAMIIIALFVFFD